MINTKVQKCIHIYIIILYILIFLYNYENRLNYTINLIISNNIHTIQFVHKFSILLKLQINW